jgi:hypothetical protein
MSLPLRFAVVSAALATGALVTGCAAGDSCDDLAGDLEACAGDVPDDFAARCEADPDTASEATAGLCAISRGDSNGNLEGASCVNFDWECAKSLHCVPIDAKQDKQECRPAAADGAWCDDDSDCLHLDCQGEGWGTAGTCQPTTRTTGPSGASCPPTETLTYANFGKPFADKYCIGCHNSALTGGDRNGAPEGYNWDQVEAIREFAMKIDGAAASGPGFTNTKMPFGPPPTLEERTKLGEWLACGAP